MKLFLEVACAVCLTVVCLLMAGCTTDEGSIPWNSPQPWEGAPNIPGMNMR